MKHILKGREINGFTLFETLYPSKLKQPRHTHTLASFSFVVAGSYVENYGRRASTRTSSTVIFHPPQESHAVNFMSEVRILSVQFDFEKFAQIREQSFILDASSSHRSETTAWLGKRIFREFRRTDSFSRLAIEGLILELLAESSRGRIGAGEKSIPRWLAEAKNFLHDNFAESFVLEDVTKVAGVHAVHLSRVFREKFGCTVGEYVRKLRVEFAARQLSASGSTIAEIAQAAGFADQSHFTRIFKDLYGVTPARYRRTSGRS